MDIELEIISPSKIVFNGKVSSLTVPGSMGSFQILKDHAPIVSSLDLGVLRVDIENQKKYFSISGGTIKVDNNKVLILADSIEDVNEIDLIRAIKSKERASERLSSRSPEIDIVRAEASLLRAINRIKLKESFNKKVNHSN